MNNVEQLKRSTIAKVSRVTLNDFTKMAQDCFDYEFDGEIKYYPFEKPTNIPQDFETLLIVGASGSGKSQLLESFGKEKKIEWNNDSMISNFNSPEEAREKLLAVGLSSIPQWVKPFHTLSNGEQFRATLARQLQDGAIIDEFTSVVDRNVAKSCCISITKYIKDKGLKNIVFATCHRDVLEFMNPSHVIDTDLKTSYHNDRKECLRRGTISIYKTNWRTWHLFSDHHYLSEKINKACRAYLVYFDDVLVGFTSILPAPNGYIKGSWREHRTVVLPDFQGMGIGSRVSEMIGEMLLQEGKRLYSKTAHHKLGFHRDHSPLWIQGASNQKDRSKDDPTTNKMGGLDTKRICFVHRYVGQDYNSKPHLHVICEEDNVDKLKEIHESNKDKFLLVYSPRESVCDNYCIENMLVRELPLSKTKAKKILKGDHIII